MKGKRRTALFSIITAIILLLCPALSSCEEIGPELLMTGQSGSTVTVTLNAPSFALIPQFGAERTEDFNALLAHIGTEITTDGECAESVIRIDGTPVISWTQKTEGDTVKTIYDAAPDKVYLESVNEDEEDSNDWSGFLENRFFRLNRTLDEMVAVAAKLPETYAETAKKSAESLSFKDFGKAVSKVSVTLKEETEIQGFRGVLLSLTQDAEIQRMINTLQFSGTQKLVILFDENEQPIRIQYDGCCGTGEETMRKVSLNWKCLRTAEAKRDDVTLKTPSVKGNDRDNMTYTREIDNTDPEKQTAKWNMQLDLKSGQDRKEIAFSGEFSFTETETGGTALLTKRQNGERSKKTVSLVTEKENGGEYSGTIEITDNSGKILTGGLSAAIRINTGSEVSFADSGKEPVDLRGEDAADAAEALQEMIAGALIRAMAGIGAEDLAFLNRDIPADVWNELTQIID